MVFQIKKTLKGNSKTRCVWKYNLNHSENEHEKWKQIQLRLARNIFKTG